MLKFDMLCKFKLKQITMTDDMAIIVPAVHLRDDVLLLVECMPVASKRAK